MEDSESGVSVQTNIERVSCSMTGDYSDSPATGADVQLLCDLVSGRSVSPPHAERRAALLECARAHRIERLAIRAIRVRGDAPQAWFGTRSGGHKTALQSP